MSEFIPSRHDENFRYTQISVPEQGWIYEKLTSATSQLKIFDAQESFNPQSYPDFYNFLFEKNKTNPSSIEKAKVLSVTDTKDWVVVKSESAASTEMRLGRWSLRVTKGQNLKVLEVVNGQNSLAVLFRDLYVESGAKLEYFLLQEFSQETQFLIRHFVHVEEGGELILRFFHQGGAKGQHRVMSSVAQKATATVEGSSKLSGKQHVDVWVESEHQGPVGHSQTAVWNVLTDEASCVFNGMIRILKDCPQTQAYQSNKSLLLSEKARAYTLPKLQIATDDVKCSHGASVSSLDESQLFYLQSRGISKDDAQKMLVTAFTEPVLRHLPEAYRNRFLKVEELEE